MNVFIFYDLRILEAEAYSGWAFSELLTDRRDKKAPLLKICHTYPTKMKLGTVFTLPKEDPKNI